MFKRSDAKTCPLLKKPCIGAECMWATTVRGTDKNTGKEVDDSGCAVAFLPMLLIEGSSQGRSTAAAVESFRNEMVKSNDAMIAVAANNIRRLSDG